MKDDLGSSYGCTSEVEDDDKESVIKSSKNKINQLYTS